MAYYQAPEPFYYSNEEVVDIRNPYSNARRNVTLTYNPTSGFHARNGRITNIQITVEANNGETFIINRRPNGAYQAGNCWTQVTRRQR